MMIRQKGTVLKWNRGQGWGFIEPDNAAFDIFVHVSEIQDRRRLIEGQRVEFESGTRQGKPIALRVVVVAEPPQTNGESGAVLRERP